MYFVTLQSHAYVCSLHVLHHAIELCLLTGWKTQQVLTMFAAHQV